MRDHASYDSVVFAGGGNRCIWQAGFWEVAAEPLGLSPRVVAGASAGATMAVMVFSGVAAKSLATLQRVLSGNTKNAYLGNLFKGRPVFPHVALFTRAMKASMDQADLERLRQGPELRVLLSRPPAWTGATGGVLLGFLCYLAEKYLTAPLHPKLPGKVGFRPEVVRVDTCRNIDEVIDLLLATSCTPPVVPVVYRDGAPVLDGGLIDNAPVAAIRPGEAPTLVLLTRRYPPAKLQGHPGRTYIQPSRPVGISKWDYTNPQGMQEAFDLGRRDAECFIAGGPAALQV